MPEINSVDGTENMSSQSGEVLFNHGANAEHQASATVRVEVEEQAHTVGSIDTYETSPTGWQTGLGLRRLAKEWAEKNQNGILRIFNWGNNVKHADKETVEQDHAPTEGGGDSDETKEAGERRQLSHPPSSEEAGAALSNGDHAPDVADGTEEPRPSHPWSPVTKPIAQAFNDGFLKPGKVMGKRLAEVWDIHDLFDDGVSSPMQRMLGRVFTVLSVGIIVCCCRPFTLFGFACICVCFCLHSCMHLPVVLTRSQPRTVKQQRDLLKNKAQGGIIKSLEHHATEGLHLPEDKDKEIASIPFVPPLLSSTSSSSAATAEVDEQDGSIIVA